MRSPEQVTWDFVQQWLSKAQKDLQAASVLLAADLDDYENVGFHALENLAKGVILKSIPSLVTPGRLPRWPCPGHDLPKLFEAAEIPVSTPERDLLVRLREFISWRGRYPIPQRPEEMMPRETIPSGGTPYMMPGNDHRLVTELFSRLERLLNLEIRNGVEP